MEWERIKAYAKDEGFREGASKAKLEDALIAVLKFKIAPETVAAEYNVDLAELKSALAEHNAAN